MTIEKSMHTESPEDEILLYLRGDLPEADRKAFEMRCAQDPALHQRLTEAREAFLALRQVQRQDLRRRLVRLDRRTGTIAWVAAALMAGLLVTAFIAC